MLIMPTALRGVSLTKTEDYLHIYIFVCIYTGAATAAAMWMTHLELNVEKKLSVINRIYLQSYLHTYIHTYQQKYNSESSHQQIDLSN